MTFTEKVKRGSGSREVIALDFDGTIVPHPGHNFPAIYVQENINKALVAVAKRRQRAGATLILWTCRHGKDLEDAVNFCKSIGLNFDCVNENYFDEHLDDERIEHARKIYATVYIDDKSPGSITYFIERYEKDVDGLFE